MTGNGSTRRHSNLIVGRQRERAQLRELLADAADGGFVLALVSGEAGIGKSTLVTDLRNVARDAGWLVLTGGCYDLETTPPYGPWSEILRAYPENSALPVVPDELRAGSGMAGIDSQTALFDLAGRFFAEVAESRPLALILEDIHWADPASLDLLRYLARARSAQPFVIAGTFRDDEITSEHPLYLLLPALVRESSATRVELQRLSGADVTELVNCRYRLSHGDQDRLVGYLFRLAEGNPFFIAELLHALEERGSLEFSTDGWRLGELSETGVPSLVQQVIARRMAALDGPGRIILDVAAVAGQDASLELLEELNGGESGELDTLLQRAFDHHLLLLQSDGRGVRFTHALVRQTVYEAIPPLRRRTLHRQVGDLLAGRARPDPARVAHHFRRAADERGPDWLVRAAERAQSIFAPETVTQLCRQAIELANQLETVTPLEIYRLQGLALETVGDFDGALESHETALNRARLRCDRRAEWRALLDLAALWASRDYDRTGDYCQQAVELARTMEDPAALGHSLNLLGNWQGNMGNPTGGVPLYEEALDLFNAAGNLEAVATTLDLLAMGHFLAGDSAAALKCLTQAIPLLRDADNRQTLSASLASAAGITIGYGIIRGVMFHELPPRLGTTPTAMLVESADIARSVGWKSGESYALGFLGLTIILRGEAREGFARLAEAMRLAVEIEHLEWIVLVRSAYALGYLFLSAPRHARDEIERGMEAASQLSAAIHTRALNGHLFTVYVETGDFEEAHRLLSDLAPLSTDSPFIHLLRTEWFAAVELALAEKRLDTALELVEELVASFPDDKGIISPEAVRLKGEVLLACGRLEEAETCLLEARRTAEILNLKSLLWRMLANLRKLYIAQGRLSEADDVRDQAQLIIDDLADQLDDDDLRSEFLQSVRREMPSAPPYGPALTSGSSFAGLTPREIEVLRLVARGMTNEEASEQLFISPRTVDQHLRSIYNKLDVTNRTAASRIATEQGIL